MRWPLRPLVLLLGGGRRVWLSSRRCNHGAPPQLHYLMLRCTDLRLCAGREARQCKVDARGSMAGSVSPEGGSIGVQVGWIDSKRPNERQSNISGGQPAAHSVPPPSFPLPRPLLLCCGRLGEHHVHSQRAYM